ncbi:DUF421 domain-containing protein [Niallia taxi]|uniref:DUF421 domain-containing protein n=1 Tax=Niallia taxi TaxID=2499688 RepID=UPI00254F2BC2|nr:DUF421 domain-containing protein [Niallia taxi]MDK8641785.1 DUF421 domain-containing protein [Niallia taxi]
MLVDITVELCVGFFTLLLMLKILGKIQFSQITPFDFITGMVLGNFVGDSIFDERTGVLDIVYSILLWGLLIYLVELLTQKSFILRSFFEGKPSMLVNKGEIDFKALKKNHIDLSQLQHLLRKQGYFSLFDAEYVILEQDGNISVAPKHSYGAPTNEDLQIPEKKVRLAYALVLDGKVNKQNLKTLQFNEVWLKKQLSQQQISDYKDVLYAEWQEDKGLQVATYNKSPNQ